MPPVTSALPTVSPPVPVRPPRDGWVKDAGVRVVSRSLLVDAGSAEQPSPKKRPKVRPELPAVASCAVTAPGHHRGGAAVRKAHPLGGSLFVALLALLRGRLRRRLVRASLPERPSTRGSAARCATRPRRSP